MAENRRVRRVVQFRARLPALRPRGRPPLSDAVRHNREHHIIRLWTQGSTREEIAKALTLSLDTVRQCVADLLRTGRLAPFGSKKALPCDVHQPRIQMIIHMRKNHATLEEISAAVGGITRERVRQIIARIVSDHGEQMVMPAEPVWTLREAAAELRVGRETIRTLCHDGAIPFRRRGRGTSGAFLLTTDSLRALRCHPRVTGVRVCCVCGRSFTPALRARSARMCSEPCRREHAHRQHREYTIREPMLSSLRGWHRLLWEQLQVHGHPVYEEWLPISRAVRRAGMSTGKLRWLQRRNMVTTRAHVSRTWRGKPVRVFAASEMDLIRHIVNGHS